MRGVVSRGAGLRRLRIGRVRRPPLLGAGCLAEPPHALAAPPDLALALQPRCRAALEGGPAAWGWDQDQRWTLARVATLIGRLFHVRYTLVGVSYLLHHLGYAPQV
ncbi:MAG TPA: winged helix-turn-helix domain-containing protein, partial [Streptosporangiaceae bacterium]|nr:winged helix-turn-helix domain-containing protein [Streptosporangiaceae bacterium]